MIEVKSWPDDLTKWDNTDPPCYLEVFGETTPVLDMTYAEVLPPGSGSMQQTASTPVYEYWWTIGHAGQRRGHHHFFGGDDSLWANLSDEAAHVYLFFPINAGWRVKEVIATVKYLSPVHNQQSLSERAATDWQKLQPLMADASTLASALGPVPVPGAAAVAPILGALSKLQIGNVPSGTGGYDWYVEKVTTGAAGNRGVMQGIMWTLPRNMFEDLGGRLTGSLAVSFIPSQQQDTAEWKPQPGFLEAHVGVFPKDGDAHWVPAQNEFVKLKISPKLPSTSTTSGQAKAP